MTKSCLSMFVALTVSVLVNCSPGGTGSEVGRICGNLYDPCGNPAKNAVVILRDIEYLAPAGTGALGKSTRSSGGALGSTITDSRGAYEFPLAVLDRGGVFCIEAWAENGKNCIFIGPIRIANVDSAVEYCIDTPFVHTDRTLKPPTSISGTILPVHDSTTTFVRAFGIDVCVEVGSDGTFLLDSLPLGDYLLQIITLRQAPSYDTVHVEAGPETTILPDTIIPSVYRVIYYGNGSTSGTAPVDEDWYDDGEKLTVIENNDNMTRAGHVFTGWNTRGDGSGTMYHAGDTLVKGADQISLYAQWAENRYSLTMTGNGKGTFTGSDSVAHGIPHAITAVPDTAYGFFGWRVISGTADIADVNAAATTVTLKGGDAVVEAVFIPVRTFIKSFDGWLNIGATCAGQLRDGGYVIVGNTGNDSVNDVFLVRTSDIGDTLWTRKFGGPGDDRGYSVQQTIDDGFIIAGTTASFGAGGNDVYLIKTSDNGDTVWTTTFGGAGEDVGRSVVEADDGGFIFTGHTTSYGTGPDEGFFAKVDANGQFLWMETTDAPDPLWVKAFSVIRSDDGNYVFTGCGEGHIVFVAKINTNGDTLWVKSCIGPDYYWGVNLLQTADGGYVIVGCTKIEYNNNYPLNSNELYLIKTDGNGDTVWTKRYNTFAYGEAYTVAQTADGGYIIGGGYMEHLSVYSGFLLKTALNGEESWNTSFSMDDNDHIGPIVTIQPTKDGGFIIGASDMSLIKTDPLGRVK